MDDIGQVQPVLTSAEREELEHIAYFLAQLESLGARGLMAPDAMRAVVAEYRGRQDAIERAGRVKASLVYARRLSAQEPELALAWADRARQLEPTCREAWSLAIEIHVRQARYDEAAAICTEAARRFPDLQRRLTEIQRDRQAHLQEVEQQQSAEALMAQAREALRQGRDSQAVDLGSQVLSLKPQSLEAMSLLAAAADRLGHLDEAISLYRALQQREPGNPRWAACAREVTARQSGAQGAARPRQVPEAAPAEPGFSWPAMAGEFLKEHWQKLILCLGVLLIVVSSTVGAQRLLGPMLWSPQGKCIIALAYTLLFAAFSYGLLRWGAAGAARTMLLTTLLVIPANFTLVGNLHLLVHPSGSSLLVLALDAGGLLLLTCGFAAGMGGQRPGLLTGCYFILSALNALLTGGITFGWGFSAFLLLACIFLVAEVATLHSEEATEEGRRVVYVSLGLLAYAFLFGAVHVVACAPSLIPALYALPVMITAIAFAQAAEQLPRFEAQANRVSQLQSGSYLLAVIAFALALARPPELSVLLSANTLATAMLGFALFAASLCAYRQPTYLYGAVSAFCVACWSASAFTGKATGALADALGRALGYAPPPPAALKSLYGVPFSLALAWLALRFSRRWQDERLARHTQAIGLTIALAACAASCLEPRISVLCLSAYSVLFALAAGVFAQPMMIYLACAAFAGAELIAFVLSPGTTLGALALGAVASGYVFLLAMRGLDRRHVDEAYRTPLLHASLTALAVGLGLATEAGLGSAAVALFVGANMSLAMVAPLFSSSLALALGALALVMLSAWGYHRRALAYAAVAAGAAAYAGTALGGLVALRVQPPKGMLVVAIGLLALLLHLGGARLASGSQLMVGDRGSAAAELQTGFPSNQASDGTFANPIAELYRDPLLHMALVAVGASWLLCPAAPDVFAIIALTLTVVTLVATVRLIPSGLLAHLATAGALGVWLFALDLAFPNASVPVGSLMFALFALVLLATAEAARTAASRQAAAPDAGGATVPHLPDADTVPAVAAVFARTLPSFTLGLLAVTALLLSLAPPLGPATVAAFVVMGVSLIWTTRFRRNTSLVYLALGCFTMAGCWSALDTWVTLASATVLAVRSARMALVLWSAGAVARRYGPDEFYSGPCFVMSLLLTLIAVPAGIASPSVMLLVALAFLLMIKSFPAAEWLYASIGALGCSIYVAWMAGPPGAALVGACVAAAFVLWTLAVLARRFKPGLCTRLGLNDLAYELPLFNSALVASLVALALRVGGSVAYGIPWTAHLELLPVLALFYLLMLTAYPDRGWVHVSVALATASIVLGSFQLWSPAGRSELLALALLLWLPAALANLWLLVGRGMGPLEEWLCKRRGVACEGYSEVAVTWSFALFGIVAVLLTARIAGTAGMAVFAASAAGYVNVAYGWAAGLAALLLLATYVLLRVRDLRLEHEMEVLYLLALLMVWWLGAPGSGALAGLGLSPLAYYPLATAMMGLVAALAGARLTGKQPDVTLWLPWPLHRCRAGAVRPDAEPDGGSAPDPKGGFGARVLLGPECASALEAFSWQACVAGALLAVAFTQGDARLPTILTFLLATVSFAVLTAWQQGVEFAYAGSATFVVAWLYAPVVAAGRRGAREPWELAIQVGLSGVLSAFVLLFGAARLQRALALAPPNLATDAGMTASGGDAPGTL